MELIQKVTARILILVLVALLPVPGAQAELADGIYEGTAPGMNGDITVRAAVLDGEIVKISADHSESAEVGAPSIDELIRRVIDVQDPDVDAVTGATETSEAFVEAMKAALAQAGWEEEAFEIDIIQRWTPSPEPTPVPVAAVSAPQISFDDIASQANGIALISGDTVVMNWHSKGDVLGYHLEIIDEAGKIIKQLDISDTQYALQRSMLSEGQTYTLTITAIPANGTLEANGVGTSARFGLFIAPTAKPTPEPTPEPVLQTGEISDSWEEIIAAIDDGTAQRRYAIGATKELDLGQLGSVHMQLAGYNLDARADGLGKAPTTWISKELLRDAQPMFVESEDVDDLTYGDSYLREYLLNIVQPAIPDVVQRRLLYIEKRTDVTGYGMQATKDQIWIPDYNEVSGEDSLYYDLFLDSDVNLAKTRNGKEEGWWLRDIVLWIYPTGTPDYIDIGPYEYSGVAIGFCL